MRFHWIKNRNFSIVEVNRFTRLAFGPNQYPFILEGTLKCILRTTLNEYPKVKEKFQNDVYVEDLVSGGTNEVEVENLKQKSMELFSKGGFNLHKWNSNIPSNESTRNSSEVTYARQMFSGKSSHTKILGLGLNKTSD